MNDQTRQKNKEEAVLLALQNDMALVRKDLSIYGMKKDGSTTIVSESENYEDLWGDALNALKN